MGLKTKIFLYFVVNVFITPAYYFLYMDVMSNFSYDKALSAWVIMMLLLLGVNAILWIMTQLTDL